MAGIHQQGFSNKLIYDSCSYQQYLSDTTGPYQYQFYEGAHENRNKCKYDNFYRPYDLVDVESELKNQTRPATKCGIYKYNNNSCGKCTVTNPIVKQNNKSENKQENKTNNVETFIPMPEGMQNVKCSLTGNLSTFDPTVPVIYPPEICPIVHNNIPKQHDKGYTIPSYINCNNYGCK